jgi:hypothetical protein
MISTVTHVERCLADKITSLVQTLYGEDRTVELRVDEQGLTTASIDLHPLAGPVKFTAPSSIDALVALWVIVREAVRISAQVTVTHCSTIPPPA